MPMLQTSRTHFSFVRICIPFGQGYSRCKMAQDFSCLFLPFSTKQFRQRTVRVANIWLHVTKPTREKKRKPWVCLELFSRIPPIFSIIVFFYIFIHHRSSNYFKMLTQTRKMFLVLSFTKYMFLSEWMIDCCLTPTQQFLYARLETGRIMWLGMAVHTITLVLYIGS